MNSEITKSRPRELRICLVMYGGVSLAVYINGVAREFYDLVRGRGIWGVLKEVLDVDITVDIVSGASAGGINGLFLSYALCHETEFSPLADLWRRKAGFAELLQRANETKAASLLNSQYMEDELTKAFQAMDASSAADDDGRDAIKPVEIGPKVPQELDCFLATTNFYGKQQTLGDFRSQPLSVKTHAATMQIKHRLGHKHPFGFPTTRAPQAGDARRGEADASEISKRDLARMARATSAFPVAFEPMLVDGKEKWGYARATQKLDDDEQAIFIDGGVLDNKPFTPALPTIKERHADRPVDRVLFFVEPDPPPAPTSDDRQAVQSESVETPNFVNVALSALSSLPSHESIVGDLEMLDRHNRRIDFMKTVLEPLNGSYHGRDPFEIEPESPRESAPPPDPQMRAYRGATIFRLLEDVVKELSLDTCAAIEKDLAKLLSPEGLGREPSPYDLENDRFVRFFEVIWRHVKDNQLELPGGTEDDTIVFDVEELNVPFVRRAYHYWAEQLRTSLDALQRADPADGSLEKVDRIRGQLSFLGSRIEMLAMLEARLLRRLSALRPKDATLVSILELWRGALSGNDEAKTAITDSNAELLSHGDAGTSATHQFASAILGAPHDGKAGGVEPVNEVMPLLPLFLDELNATMSEYWDLESGSGRNAATARFRNVDAWRFPALAYGDVGELDKVEYYRISPRDSCVDESIEAMSKWKDDPMTKVAGRQLGHFGGFLKRSWRSNDLMWGRLDAATVLWDVLLRRRGLKPSRVRAKSLLEHEKFSQLPEDVRAAVTRFAETEQEPEEFSRWLLQHHQRTLVAEGVSSAVADAVHEEVDRRNPKWDLSDHVPLQPDDGDTDKDDFRTSVTKFLREFGGDTRDPLLNELRNVLVEKAPSGKEIRIEEFFGTSYNVGNEDVNDLDRVQLAVMSLHSARVLSNMFVRLWPGNWFQRKALSRISVGVTTLHLAARSIRDGIFPIVWLSTLMTCGALVAAQLFGGRNLTLTGWGVSGVLLLTVLLGFAPIWFGRFRRFRWIAWALSVAAAGYVIAGHAPGDLIGLLRDVWSRLVAFWTQLGVGWKTISASALSLGAGWWLGRPRRRRRWNPLTLKERLTRWWKRR